jgi:hypothetical protein
VKRKAGGPSVTYPTGLIGPKCGTIVFSSDVRPFVDRCIRENNSFQDNNYHSFSSNGVPNATTGGIDYVAHQFQEYGNYKSVNAATRTLYRLLYEGPIMGAHLGDALALACDTTLYAENVEEYPSRLKAALDIVFIAADEAGEILSPFDLQERATALWHDTYDRYVLEMEPFREKYAVARVKRQEQRRKFRAKIMREGRGFGALA